MLEKSKQVVTTIWVYGRDEVAAYPNIALAVIIGLALSHVVF